jgi:hypothetical protein
MIRIWGSGGKIGKLGGCHLVMKMTGDRGWQFILSLSPLLPRRTLPTTLLLCVEGDATSICADQPSRRECVGSSNDTPQSRGLTVGGKNVSVKELIFFLT